MKQVCFLIVAPDSLTLEGLKDIDNCTSCLAGSDGEKFKVFCQINGGTEPTSVSMLIGNDSLRNVQRFEDSRYVVFFHLLNTDHGKLMRCLVKNEALTSPISATAPLYVISKYNLSTNLSFTKGRMRFIKEIT